MLTASSPISFPASSSPAKGNKQPLPHDAANAVPKPRAVGGFLIDDNSDDEDETCGSAPKKRMIDSSSQEDETQTPATSMDASSPKLTTAVEESQGAEGYDSQIFPGVHLVDSLEGLTSLEDGQASSEPLFDFRQTDALLASLKASGGPLHSFKISTCSGKTLPIRQRKATTSVSYETMVAARSRTKQGRATKSYYGIDINELVDGAKKQIAEKAGNAGSSNEATDSSISNTDQPMRSLEDHTTNIKKPKESMLWTEKYRARTFMDLVGDDLTNRQVLRWLKRWDPLVFPHAAKSRLAIVRRPDGAARQQQQQEEEKPHRKILMLTGPPGLGKTTLAHVCARQAGYEVMEINASDDRSRDVVRGRIRTSLGTESVKTVEHKKVEPGQPQKIARPVCVVVDEVDGVVSGSGASGEGGFVKALIDLVLLDQKNSTGGAAGESNTGRRKKKADDFRQMRPLILVCNDVYHPSLRPLRQSALAEIIHVGKPSIDAVVNRLKGVFEKEGIPCEKDAARKLCEAAWGMTSGIDAKRGAEGSAEGDLRGVMVVGEWVAGRLKATLTNGSLRLTREWIEQNIIHDLAHGGGGARGLGRGSTKDIVSRIFQEGGGFPKQVPTTSQSKKTRHEQPKAQLGFSEHQKKYAMERLREMVDTSGEVDRIMTEIFSEYPNREFNDDSYLTKPDAAYDWMQFHDMCSSRLFSSQDWELAPYLSQPVLACHHLFASPHRHYPSAGYDRKWGGDAGEEAAVAPLPFSGPRADFLAHEAEKQNRALLQNIQGQLPASLMRSFRSPEQVATDFLPYLVRLVSPDVKPVVVGGSDKGASIASVRRESEKIMVRHAAEVLATVGIALQKGKIEEANPSVVNRTQWVYRMEPDLDALSTFETYAAHLLGAQAPTRYAVRQVLDQELHKTIAMRESEARQARFKAGNPMGSYHTYDMDDKENAGRKKAADEKFAGAAAVLKRDFFGRVITEAPRQLEEMDGNTGERKKRKIDRDDVQDDARKVWVTFHEGLNNAVKKPISLDEFLKGL